MDVLRYRPIFYPRSLAVIGASDSPAKFGGGYLQAIRTFGYKGKVFPVNPKERVVQGLTAYPSLEAIPEPVESAVITVPAPQVPEAVRGCVKKAVQGVSIATAGFREAGAEGEALEREVVRIAREGGVRIIGPNCFGVYSPQVGLTMIVGGQFPALAGSVGVVSQSGGVASDLIYMGAGRSVYFSVVVSCGNACDLDPTEMLRYFEADPATSLVGAYVEGVEDGRAFFEALRACARKKPVVLLKGGLSEQGSRGTLGHTGSLAGSRQAWQAAVKSAGAVCAFDVRDLADCLMAFNCLPGFTGGGAGIMAPSGARGVDGLDAALDQGFPVPVLDKQTVSRIASLLPPAGGKAANPLDLAGPSILPEKINPLLEILAESPSVGFVVMYQMLFYFLRMVSGTMPPWEVEGFMSGLHETIAAKARAVREKHGKPLSMVLVETASTPELFDTELQRIKARQLYTAGGIPCFDSGLRLFSVLRRVADYYTARGHKLRFPTSSSPSGRGPG